MTEARGQPTLALVLAILAGAAGCATTRPDPPVADPEPRPAPASERTEPAPPPAAAARPSRASARVTFAAVGDMMLGTDYPADRLPDDDGATFLGEVTHILKSADLAFGNLEGVLVDGGEPAKQCGNPNACYLFRSPTRYAAHYAAAGFDALSLATNHARDFGEDGRSATMRALRHAGIAHSGREGDFATLATGNLSVSFVAFSVTQESNLLHDYALAAQIVGTQAERHDVVVVSFHGGAEGRDATRIPFAEEEYFGEPRGDVVRFARSMIDAGADFVFGHGPHVVRGMELYRDRLIAYSLGNFATYYGISVSGLAGIAPILVATLDEEGRFVEGRIHSTVQVRPGGPRPDPGQRALHLLRDLSAEDFVETGLRFGEDGHIGTAPRSFIRPTADYAAAPSED